MSNRTVGGFILVSMVFAASVVHAAPATDLHVNLSPGVGAGIGASSTEVAEQFTVPAGQTWRVTGVKIDGFATPGPLHTVRFYANQGGFPGSTVCERLNSEALGEFVTSISQIRDPELRLASACVLGPGNYYVGVSGPMQINTSSNLIGNESLGRGGSSCPNFVPISACIVGLPPQEFQFRIRGCQAASCEFPLEVLAQCIGSNLRVDIRDGDLPLALTGSGPGLPETLNSYGLNTVVGPGLWQSLLATEQGGDSQSTSLPTLNCGPRSVTLVESGGSTEVDENQPDVPDTYTLVLDSSPNAGETVTITTSSDTTLGVTTSPSQVQFNATDWSDPKPIEVFAVDDDVPEDPVHTDTIIHSLFSNGGAFNADVPVPNVVVSIVDKLPTSRLEVIVNEPAFGLVESSPAGISCPGTCSFEFLTTDTVELTVQGVDGGQFFGWGGDCTGLGACSVPMDLPGIVFATVGGPDAVFVNDFE